MKTHEYVPIWDAAIKGNKTLSPRIARGQTFGTLVWDYVQGAVSYRISSISETGVLTPIASDLTFNKYNITGLTMDFPYTFLLQYYDSEGYSSADPINHIQYIPSGGNVVIPPLPVAIPGDTTVTLTWDAIEGATKYRVAIAQNGGTPTVIDSNVLTTTYTVTDLINGQTYDFLVQAFDPNASRVWSSSNTILYCTATPHAYSYNPP